MLSVQCIKQTPGRQLAMVAQPATSHTQGDISSMLESLVNSLPVLMLLLLWLWLLLFRVVELGSGAALEACFFSSDPG